MKEAWKMTVVYKYIV